MPRDMISCQHSVENGVPAVFTETAPRSQDFGVMDAAELRNAEAVPGADQKQNLFVNLDRSSGEGR